MQNKKCGTGLIYQAVPILTYSADFSEKQLATLCDGTMVATWLLYDMASPPFITGRIYNSQFQPITDEFKITESDGNHWEHSLTPLQAGGFVITWKSEVQPVEMADDENFNIAIFARVFSRLGKPQTDPMKVSLTEGLNTRATAYGLPGGGFAVVWVRASRNERQGVYLRIFDSSGAPKTQEVFVAHLKSSSFPGDITALGFVTQEGKINLFLHEEGTVFALARSFDSDGNPLTKILEGDEMKGLAGYESAWGNYLRARELSLE